MKKLLLLTLFLSNLVALDYKVDDPSQVGFTVTDGKAYIYEIIVAVQVFFYFFDVKVQTRPKPRFVLSRAPAPGNTSRWPGPTR